MNRFLFSALLLIGIIHPLPALSDYDPVLEAQEEAARQAAKSAEAQRKAEVKARMEAAEMEAYRKYLGKEAEGKSNDQVRALYQAKVAREQAQGLKAQAEAMKLFGQAQAAAPQSDAMMKQHIGKTFAELQKMSPEELEAFANEMEKKHLQGMGN